MRRKASPISSAEVYTCRCYVGHILLSKQHSSGFVRLAKYDFLLIFLDLDETIVELWADNVNRIVIPNNNKKKNIAGS